MARKREALRTDGRTDGRTYGRTDGRTDIHGTKTYICLPQGETYNKRLTTDIIPLELLYIQQ